MGFLNEDRDDELRRKPLTACSLCHTNGGEGSSPEGCATVFVFYTV